MFHSEYGQDKFVADLLGYKRGGTFVEFGALDGLLHSNSLYFERELGWQGLLIEANPTAFDAMIQSGRKCDMLNAAIYDLGGSVEFEKIDGNLYGWSGIREDIEPDHWQRIWRDTAAEQRSNIRVQAVPLETVLLSFGVRDIDYMSIDVEGAELKILSVFPFEKFNIDVLGVEDNFGNEELDALIKRNGFQFLQKVGPDRMYRRVSENTPSSA